MSNTIPGLLLKASNEVLALIAKEGEMGLYGTGSAGGGVAGHPGGAAAPEPQPQTPAAAPQPGAAPHYRGVSARGIMSDVHHRLDSAMDKLEEDGGDPTALGNELRTLAGLLMTIAGQEEQSHMPTPPPAPPAPNQPPKPPTPPAAAAPTPPPPQAPKPPPFGKSADFVVEAAGLLKSAIEAITAEVSYKSGAAVAKALAAVEKVSQEVEKSRPAEVAKAELDDYTAMCVTVQAAQQRVSQAMWELLPEDPNGAVEQLKLACDMLEKAAGMMKTTKSAPTEVQFATKKARLTPEQFVKYAAAQLAKAAKDAPEVAAKRVEALAKATAVMKAAVGAYPDNAFTGETQKPEGFEVEIEEAYVGSADGGAGLGGPSAQDLTTKSDQDEKETPPEDQDSGKPGDSSIAENPAGDAKTNAMEGASNNGGTDIPSSNASQDSNFAENFGKTGAQNLSKAIDDLKVIAQAVTKRAPEPAAQEDVSWGKDGSKVAKADTESENPWPLDMNTEEFMEAEKVAKREDRVQDSWGKDPWAGA